MALTPRIEIRQNQTLVMTPQLQQAIKLLQMSNVELAAYVEAEVEKNPVLELADPIPMPSNGTGGMPVSGQGDSDFLDMAQAQVSLWDHLREQIGEIRLSSELTESALVLVDELEDDGYLRTPLSDISSRHRLPVGKLSEALKVLHTCDPAGVGARNLQECLALQLLERDRFDPAMKALLNNLPLVAKGHFSVLERICGVDAEDIEDMISELRALDPKPGLRFAENPIQMAVPDIFVSVMQTGQLSVELNTETLPRVLIDNIYSAELDITNKTAKAFVSECRTSANWLIRSLEQRARTILKVATEIAQRQERFFSNGVSALRPLTQKTIADRIGMHESTISRVTAGKYISCEQGNFEFRYFFSSAIQAVSGGESFSATAVQNRIRNLTDAEEANRPLSDDKLVVELKKEGIDIARRTVAKYRDVMGIPSSVERRRQKLGQTGS